MPRRKRKDPDDAPIDGDYTMDVVLNKDPNKAYALVHQDDMPKMVGRGYRRTLRADDSARPAYDATTEGDFIVGGQLVLMENDKDRADAIQRRSEREFSARMKGEHDKVRAHVRANPGSKFQRAAG